MRNHVLGICRLDALRCALLYLSDDNRTRYHGLCRNCLFTVQKGKKSTSCRGSEKRRISKSPTPLKRRGFRLKTNSRTAKMLVNCNEFVDIHEIVI